MAVNANFGLAGPAPNFGNALQTGFEQGRQVAQQRNSDNALAAYQANPNDPGALNALTIADPARGTAIMQAQTMQQATADKAAQRTAVKGIAPGGDGTIAAGAGLKYAQATGDLQGGMSIEKFSGEARKEHVAAIDAAAQAVATVGIGAKAITDPDPATQLAKRTAYVQTQTPYLTARGITPNQIAGQDWTDNGIDQTTNNALGLVASLKRSDAADDQTFKASQSALGRSVTMRGQDIGAATAAAGQGITMRGQDMTHGDAQAKLATQTLDAPTLATISSQYLDGGDKSVVTGFGRSPAAMAQIRQAISAGAAQRGMSGAQIAAKMAEFEGLKSGQRTAGVKGAQTDLAGTEFDQMAPLALSASQGVPRSGFLPFGKAQVMFDNNTNDPALRQFAAANNAIVNTYSRTVSPTGVGTESDRQHARDLLSTAHDQTSYAATVAQMQQEASAARAAPGITRRNLSASYAGNGPSPAHPAAATPTVIHYDAQGRRIG